jgi:general secretion pathway protein A
MYRKFYGLSRNPFEISPDSYFFYPTSRHNEALVNMCYGVHRRRGFVVLTGEVGTGKTLLVRSLLDNLNDNHIAFAFVYNPTLSVQDFLLHVLTDLHLPLAVRTKSDMLSKLTKYLVARSSSGSTTALIVDEAQLLSWELLEEIRLLTNLETSQHKLLQVVLAGQPELDHKLDSPQLRQLQQRIALRCHLDPLTLQELRGYIHRRLELAGANSEGCIFPDETVAAVHRYSCGIPRLANTICENSLISGFSRQVRQITSAIIQEVATELRLSPATEPSNPCSDNQRDLPCAVSATFNRETVSSVENGNKIHTAVVASKHNPREHVPTSPQGVPASAVELSFIPTAEVRRGTQAVPNSSGLSEIFKTNADQQRPVATSLTLNSGSAAPGEGFGRWLGLGTQVREQQDSKSQTHSMLIATVGAVLVLTLGSGVVLYLHRVGGVAAAASTPMEATRPVTAEPLQPLMNQATFTARRIPTASRATPSAKPEDSGGVGARPIKSTTATSQQPAAHVPLGMTGTKVLGTLNAHPLLEQHAVASQVVSAPPLNEFSVPTDNYALPEIPSALDPKALSPPAYKVNNVFTVGETVKGPQIRSTVLPEYPEIARQFNTEGDVVLDITIDTNGDVTDIDVVSGPVVLRQAAQAAVRHWKYEPSRSDGQPITVHERVVVGFRL